MNTSKDGNAVFRAMLNWVAVWPSILGEAILTCPTILNMLKSKDISHCKGIVPGTFCK
ncbi:Uncharacterized protein DAT39_023593, partial [Clarias magur]